MSKWQAEKAERNRQSLARLNRALPRIFPSARHKSFTREFLSVMLVTRALSLTCCGGTIRYRTDGVE
jgi:hypothetical protein